MSEWDPRSFSAYLDAAMRNRGIRNDAELARKSEINKTQLGNWRNGSSRPSMRLLRKVADALDAPANDLYVLAGWLERDDEHEAEPPLPEEIRRLIALYQSMTTAAGRRQVLEQIDIVWRGLEAKYTKDIEPPAPPARKRAS